MFESINKKIKISKREKREIGDISHIKIRKRPIAPYKGQDA